MGKVLQYKHKWSGPYAEKYLHLGARSTQHVEGTHWQIKETLQTTRNLVKTFNAIDIWMCKTAEEERKKFFTEKHKQPVIDEVHTEVMKNLLGKVSFYAINYIKQLLCKMSENAEETSKASSFEKTAKEAKRKKKKLSKQKKEKKLETHELPHNDDLFVLLAKRDFEDKYIEEIKRKWNKVDSAIKQLHFKVNSAILPECYNGTIDVQPDGWYGFRTISCLVKDDEDVFPLVKKEILDTLNKYATIYRDVFHYDIEEL
ncbi:hypothetical protein EC973_004480 [Apophysomyces ossiformis]|uniref:Uncharacterized protein n=1 Tax=Apophysomyces ossiformis TaxID=679940 RepID=A0A8H7ELF9_9FUNG|nr:hypothetical protein EC973_004480 [Apophysomyces ossiformis]